MGLIANQMLVEMLCNITEKLKRVGIKNENKIEKNERDGNGKEEDYESSEGNGI